MTEKSPNTKIDKAINKLMADIEKDTIPPDTKVKIIAAAISWEKVKHAINSDSDDFDMSRLLRDDDNNLP